MGRHSAPDSEEQITARSMARPSAVSAVAPSVAPSAAASAASSASPSAVPLGTVRPTHARHHGAEHPAAADGRAESGTHGDLRMLRSTPALRARCAAAVIVPFLLYTAVLIVIARTDVYVLWVWIPTIVGGILAGTFLDAAHRHHQ